MNATKSLNIWEVAKMTDKTAKPLSILDIRNVAKFIRKLIDVSPDKNIDMAKVLDVLTIKLQRFDFNYVVLDDDDPIFKKNEEAKTDIVNGTLYIKESLIWEAVHKKYCRSNFTIGHEIGHFVLHRVLNLMDFSRAAYSTPKKIYEDPEWQADTFASELLMPYEQCMTLSPAEIRRAYHVTKSAAETRYNKIHR